MDWYRYKISEILKKFNVSENKGICKSSLKKRQKLHGKNLLAEKRPKSLFKKFLEQFSDFMVITLLIASAVSFIMAITNENGDYVDPIIILFIVIMNAIIGVTQESKAEKAINSLKKLSSPHANVIRDGCKKNIMSEDVVPGDILLLDTGDVVCADARIIESHDLRVEESSLTGESNSVTKDATAILPEDTPIAEQKNMLFATSSITAGNAKAIVVETGMNTQVGKIANLINKENSPQTPLQLKLANTGKILGIGVIICCCIIFILGILQNTEPFEMFMISISLAVAAIPEGLPAVVTIVLASGVRRMTSKNAIIRKLPAVETLGNANVICSDKTGTLTQNKMSVVEIKDVSGETNPKLSIGKKIISYSVLCNNSEISSTGLGGAKTTGEPTENALLMSGIKHGMNKKDLEKTYKRIGEIPFDSSRKLMTTVHKCTDGKFKVITKGAPDFLIKYCTHYETNDGVFPINSGVLKKIEQQNENMASRALRVLAVAYKDVNTVPKRNEVENKLIFCGLIGLIDPPRPQAKKAVRECLSAGIKPVMITGDHVITAIAIAKDLGIMQANDKAMTGKELEKMSQKDLEKNIFSYSVFARVSPEHKVRIVKAFQANGSVVAMTGDGVNDAPALKVSDIGCAMGMTGTDVAKSAADMIMTDDNFSTIVEAVRQGRGIFDNIKKTVHFLISSNVGEIITVLTSFLLKLPSPLLAIQLLWVNLVTDSFPALALGMEPVDKDIMKRKPEKTKSLFSKSMAFNIAVEGSFIGAISLLAFTIGRIYFDFGCEPVVGRTMAFAVLSLSQIVHAFNVRSEKSIFEVGIFGNVKMIYSFILCTFLQVSVISIPMLNAIFDTKRLNFSQWFIVLVLSVSPLIISELEKLLIYYGSKTKKDKKLYMPKANVKQ